MPAAPLPVTLITGYLGAGKTTLVNHLVASGRGKRIAVVDNEIAGAGPLSGRSGIVELRDGCICHTLQGDLIRVLSELVEHRERFDNLVIETTGLSTPDPVAAAFLTDPALRRSLRLDAIVSVVDARHVWTQLSDSRECVRQIELADVLLVNKVDLVSVEETRRLEKVLRGMNARASVHRVRHSAVDAGAVLDLERFDNSRARGARRFEGAEGAHDATILTVNLSLGGGLDPRQLNEWLCDLVADEGVEILRIKGVVALHADERRFLLQGVGHLFEGRPGRPWEPSEERASHLVLIGRGLDRPNLERGFALCRVEPPAGVELLTASPARR